MIIKEAVLITLTAPAVLAINRAENSAVALITASMLIMGVLAKNSVVRIAFVKS